MNWNELNIAMVGGDAREQEIARCAVACGAHVRALGFPWPKEGIAGVQRHEALASVLHDADVALFPIPGITPDGALFAPQWPGRIIPGAEVLAGMRARGHIILGWADDKLKAHCAGLGITLHEYEWDQDLMYLRGPAIVEGMLRVLIENTEITIHKSNICLVGQGTIGKLAMHTLIGLGARVHVAARNAVQRAAAHAAGAEAHDLTELDRVLPTMDIVIGTTPARVVTEPLLALLSPRALVVDLAAPPGSIDRDAAQRLGLRCVWARGLGARAPITVGRSQWSGIRRRIETILGERA